MPTSRDATRVRGTSRAIALVAALAIATVVAGQAAVVRATEDPDADLAAAEARMLDLINADRIAVGLVPFRGDPRLTTLARERSTEMAATGLFSHTTAAGGTVFDLLTLRGITWYAASEVIAWNDVAGGVGSADMAHAGWTNSQPHRAILRASDLNYVGVGTAYDPNRGARYWTAIAVREPDRTGAVGKIQSLVPIAGSATPTSVRITLTWGGRDVPLQVLTAGLRDFQVQRRVNGGAWRTLLAATTSTRATQTLTRGARYEYRARARDRRGNYGAWSAPAIIAP